MLYVDRIAYDAKGQCALIAYGNGVMTRYAYDPQTFRLRRLRSERYIQTDAVTYAPTGTLLQDNGYDYDLVGNIVAIRDRVPGSGIVNNPDSASAVDPALAQLLASGDALIRRFSYDPIYRLVSATGRECDSPPDGPPWLNLPRCTDFTKTSAYHETYHYDAMGSILRLEHKNNTGGFVRRFTTETANNRLESVKIGQNSYAYTFDANGNMRSETTSRHFDTNHANQMKAFRTQTEGAEPSVYAHYLYDSSGQRVKKLVRKQGGQVQVTHYIDAVFEHHRWGGPGQIAENNHVHVMDDKQRIALVRLGPSQFGDTAPAIQFELADHLGSSNVIVDPHGALVNREEFTPYGETSFGSFAKKRYRFTGVEQDEENALNYHGARYYVPWLCRWTTSDPSGTADGLNLYSYATLNPLSLSDKAGRQSEDSFDLNDPASVQSYAERTWDALMTRTERIMGRIKGQHWSLSLTQAETEEPPEPHLARALDPGVLYLHIVGESEEMGAGIRRVGKAGVWAWRGYHVYEFAAHPSLETAGDVGQAAGEILASSARVPLPLRFVGGSFALVWSTTAAFKLGMALGMEEARGRQAAEFIDDRLRENFFSFMNQQIWVHYHADLMIQRSGANELDVCVPKGLKSGVGGQIFGITQEINHALFNWALKGKLPEGVSTQTERVRGGSLHYRLERRAQELDKRLAEWITSRLAQIEQINLDMANWYYP